MNKRKTAVNYMTRTSHETAGVREHFFADLDDAIKFCDARFMHPEILSVAVLDLRPKRLSKPVLHWRSK